MLKMFETSESKVTVRNLFSDSLVNRWLKFAAVADKSIATYSTAVRQLLKHFQDNGISKPVRDDLENWRDMLLDDGKSASTIKLYVTSCKLFFRWLDMEKIYPNIADTAEQSRALLEFSKGKGSVKDLRDRAIIALMLSAGLRTIEICRADVKDIRRLNGVTFLLVQGKGRTEKDAMVRIAPQVFSLIQSYLKARGKVNGNEPLFVATSNRCKGKRLDTQTVRKMVKADLRGIGLDSDRLTAHSLRHTAATTMLLNGAKLEQVQQALRHRQIVSTMIYHHAIERLKNTAECIAANAIFRTCRR